MAFCQKCGDTYSDKRKQLGYRTCLSCGSPALLLPVVPVNKSNYTVGTLKQLQHSYK